MQLTFLFAVFLSFARLFSQVLADSVQFELIGVSTGNKFKFDTIGPNTDELLILGSTYPSMGKVTDDGFLKLNNTLFVSVNTKQQYSVVNTSRSAAKGFYIKHGNLLYNMPFIAHEQDGNWILYTTPQDKMKDLNISVAAVTTNGSFAPDFPLNSSTPTSSHSSQSSHTSRSSQSSHTSQSSRSSQSFHTSQSFQSSLYGTSTATRKAMTGNLTSVTMSANSTITSNGTIPTITPTSSAAANTSNVTSSSIATASVAANNANKANSLYSFMFSLACGLAFIL